MTRFRRLLLAGLLGLTALLTAWLPPAAAADVSAAGATWTVYIVRHAEKAADDPRDPGLTEAGRVRARELARVLADEPVSHIYSTPLRRTRDTLAPLAAARGLAVTPIREVSAQAAALLGLPGGAVAVVAGHSNTVPALVAALGGQVSGSEPFDDGPRLPDAAHDRLFALVLTRDGDGAPRLQRLLELRYGGP